jgi:hypothetical protein
LFPLKKSSLLGRSNRVPDRLHRFESISSLQGTSNLPFARSMNSMDGFENPFIGQLLGTIRCYS